jgi:hypothetical protein
LANKVTFSGPEDLLKLEGLFGKGSPGASYAGLLKASGGSGGYAWSVSNGTLPPGLEMDPLTGLIHGVVEVGAAPSYAFQVKVTDGSNMTATLDTEISVVNPTTLALGTPYEKDHHFIALPGMVRDTKYSTRFGIVGALGTNYNWSISGGTLPAGLNIDPATGLISGLLNRVGQYLFTLELVDGNGICSLPAQMTVWPGDLSLPDPIFVTRPSEVRAGKVDESYTFTISATGGAPPYVWQVTSGPLPYGLMLEPATGEVSGIPSVGGDFPVKITVADTADAAQTPIHLDVVFSIVAASSPTPSADVQTSVATAQASSPAGHKKDKDSNPFQRAGCLMKVSSPGGTNGGYPSHLLVLAVCLALGALMRRRYLLDGKAPQKG